MSRPRFLPDHLRPATPRRRPRGRLALVAALPGCLLLLPLWRVQAVDVSACSGLPVTVEESLRELEGRSPLTIDLDQIREQVEQWPGVANVEVHLELPGTLHVAARQATVRASVPVGRGWHGVDDAGHLTGALEQPVLPSLEGFHPSPEDLRRALDVSDRLSATTRATVRAVRQITPSDLEVTLDAAGTLIVVHVKPQPTAAEKLWCGHLTSGRLHWQWADLRWDSRLVLGRAEHASPEPPHLEHGGAL